MPEELSKLNFDEDLKEVLSLSEAEKWKLQAPGGLEVLATLSPASVAGEVFQARLHWQIYPDQAASMKFRDPETGRLDARQAWPTGSGFRPDQFDMCVNFTSEGFTTHPEWKNDLAKRWDPRGNALLKSLRMLQSHLDEHFNGRYK